MKRGRAWDKKGDRLEGDNSRSRLAHQNGRWKRGVLLFRCISMSILEETFPKDQAV